MLLADRRDREEDACGEAAGVLDVVLVRDVPPFARPAVVLTGDARKGLAALRDVCVRAVRGCQVQLSELLLECLVLAQRDGERRAQRETLRAEERELLLDAFDDAAKAIAILISAECAL